MAQFQCPLCMFCTANRSNYMHHRTTHKELKRMLPSEKVNNSNMSDIFAAINELAALYHSGALETSANPAGFIRAVVNDIKMLRNNLNHVRERTTVEVLMDPPKFPELNRSVADSKEVVHINPPKITNTWCEICCHHHGSPDWCGAEDTICSCSYKTE